MTYYLITKIISVDIVVYEDSWKSILEPLCSSILEGELTISNKINTIENNGIKIKDIAKELQLSLKEGYHYLKKFKVESLSDNKEI